MTLTTAEDRRLSALAHATQIRKAQIAAENVIDGTVIDLAAEMEEFLLNGKDGEATNQAACRRTIDRLQAENERFQTENERLERWVGRVNAENGDLEKAVGTLRADVETLEASQRVADVYKDAATVLERFAASERKRLAVVPVDEAEQQVLREQYLDGIETAALKLREQTNEAATFGQFVQAAEDPQAVAQEVADRIVGCCGKDGCATDSGDIAALNEALADQSAGDQDEAPQFYYVVGSAYLPGHLVGLPDTPYFYKGNGEEDAYPAFVPSSPKPFEAAPGRYFHAIKTLI